MSQVLVLNFKFLLYLEIVLIQTCNANMLLYYNKTLDILMKCINII